MVCMRSVAVVARCTDFSWVLMWNLLANLMWHQPTLFYWDGVWHFYWNLVTHFSGLIVTCRLNNLSYNRMALGSWNIVAFWDSNLPCDFNGYFIADLFNFDSTMWCRYCKWCRRRGMIALASSLRVP